MKWFAAAAACRGRRSIGRIAALIAITSVVTGCLRSDPVDIPNDKLAALGDLPGTYEIRGQQKDGGIGMIGSVSISQKGPAVYEVSARFIDDKTKELKPPSLWALRLVRFHRPMEFLAVLMPNSEKPMYLVMSSAGGRTWLVKEFVKSRFADDQKLRESVRAHGLDLAIDASNLNLKRVQSGAPDAGDGQISYVQLAAVFTSPAFLAGVELQTIYQLRPAGTQ